MTKEEGQKAFTEVWHVLREYEDADLLSDETWEKLIGRADKFNKGLQVGTELEILRRNLMVGLLNYFVERYRRQKEAQNADRG